MVLLTEFRRFVREFIVAGQVPRGRGGAFEDGAGAVTRALTGTYYAHAFYFCILIL